MLKLTCAKTYYLNRKFTSSKLQLPYCTEPPVFNSNICINFQSRPVEELCHLELSVQRRRDLRHGRPVGRRGAEQPVKKFAAQNAPYYYNCLVHSHCSAPPPRTLEHCASLRPSHGSRMYIVSQDSASPPVYQLPRPTPRAILQTAR